MFKKIALCAVLLTSSIASAKTHFEKAYIEQAEAGNIEYVEQNIHHIKRRKIIDKAIRKAASKAARLIENAKNLVVCKFLGSKASIRGRFRAIKRLNRIDKADIVANTAPAA